MLNRKTWLVVLCLTFLVAGCPLVDNRILSFTSADTSTGGFFANNTDTFDEGAPEAAGEGDGGEARNRAVIEPDLYRRSGNLLYVLNQFRGLSIVDLDTESLLVQVPIKGIPKELYFSENTAYVLVDNVQEMHGADVRIANTTSARVYAVDVRAPATATITAEMDLPGNLVESRLVGDVLYAVTAQYSYGYYYEADGGYVDNGGESRITSIDVSRPDTLVAADELLLRGAGHIIHVNETAVFVATVNWNSNSTLIRYIDISDPQGALVEVGEMAVRGNVGDKFKLDAWNGALRVVSSDWQGQRQVYVSTFDLADPALTMLAETPIAGAEGETLFATRFDGPRAYVVTFLVVDPLFVMDLSDPAQPTLLGALEVPGYSTHIEAQGDRLIALGVDDTNGRRVSVSIFDVGGDGAPTLVDRETFGENWSWSSAYSDVKAFTVLEDLLIVPFSGWSEGTGGFDRLQFVSYTPDSLSLRGSVDLQGSILRSFEYAPDYYGVTTEQLSRIDATNLDKPTVASTIVLAENLVDYLPVSEDLGVEIVARQTDGRVLVRTVDALGTPLGEILVDGGTFQNAWVHNDHLVLVGARWEEAPHYLVTQIDLRSPTSPEVNPAIEVALTPLGGYYYYGGGFPEAERFAADVVSYPYYPGAAEETAFLLGDSLVLRGYADDYDRVIGDKEAIQGLAVVDLLTGTWEKSIGLGRDYIVSLQATDDKIYLSTKARTGIQLFNPMTAYYVQELDILQGVEGPLTNVPGALVDYNPTSDVLVLLDHQWQTGGGVATSLETVRWTGSGTVTPLDSLALPEYAYNHRADGGRIYFESYSEGSTLNQVAVDDDGSLSLSTPLNLEDTYGYLLDVSGDHAFISIGGRGIAHYTFNDGVGTLTQLVEVAGYPSVLRVENDIAYFPLGYYGLVTLML